MWNIALQTPQEVYFHSRWEKIWWTIGISRSEANYILSPFIFFLFCEIINVCLWPDEKSEKKVMINFRGLWKGLPSLYYAADVLTFEELKRWILQFRFDGIRFSLWKENSVRWKYHVVQLSKWNSRIYFIRTSSGIPKCEHN